MDCLTDQSTVGVSFWEENNLCCHWENSNLFGKYLYLDLVPCVGKKNICCICVLERIIWLVGCDETVKLWACSVLVGNGENERCSVLFFFDDVCPIAEPDANTC